MHPSPWRCALVAAILLTAAPARATCNYNVIPLVLVKSAVERHWAALAQQKTYAWGDVRPYGSIAGKRMTLTRGFDTLTGAQKLQVLEPLWLGYADITPGLVMREFTAAERERITRAAPNYYGSMSPYEVYTDDGVLVSEAYDGCTRFAALTERDRFSVYWNRPRARTQHSPLAPANEQDVKTRFWRSLGYHSASKYWIGWVPERGYFEIDVPDDPSHWYLQALQPFWLIAPTTYRFVVYANDGTRLFDHAAGKVDVPRVYTLTTERRDPPRWRSLD